MYRIILLAHKHKHKHKHKYKHTHTLITFLFVKYDSIVGNTSLDFTNMCDSCGVPFTDSRWEKDRWPLLPQERRYHHVASIHLWQVLVKHTSRGDAALLSSPKTSTVRRECSRCSLIYLSHLPQNFYLKGLMIKKPRTKSPNFMDPVNKFPSTDRILLTLVHFTSRQFVSLRCIILSSATKFLKRPFDSFYITNCYLLWLLNALPIYGRFLI